MAFNDDHDYVTIYLDGYVSPEDHIRHVQEAAKGLVRAHVECDTESDYGGGQRAVMYVAGYKPLTAADKEAKRLQRLEAEAELERREREHYERLQAKYGKENA
jgi:hypothetical protein